MPWRLWLSLPMLGCMAAGWGGDLCAQVQPPAQVQAKPAATGRVSGSVSCSDTNAPARFAVVVLERISAGSTGGGHAAAGSAVVDSGAATTAITDLNGQFVMEKVPAGQYLVLGSFVGYLNPLALFEKADLKKMSEETLKKLEALVPVVTVAPNQPATVTLRLEHASELRGMVSYDDGSPAVGLGVRLLRKRPDGVLEEARNELVEQMGLFGGWMMTDDRGQFRVVGVAPGEYVAEVMFRAEQVAVSGVLSGETNVSVVNGEEGAMEVYSGNVFRKKEAKSTKVGTGDEVAGMDIVIPLDGMHTVRGTLVAARDGHALNAGQVELRYADDNELMRRATVDADGEFGFAYVPDGSYVVKAGSALDVEVEERADGSRHEGRVLERYGQAAVPVLVDGDVAGVSLAVPAAGGGKPEN